MPVTVDAHSVLHGQVRATARARLASVFLPLAIYGLARLLSAAALLWAAPSQMSTAEYRLEQVRNGFYFVFATTAANPSYGELMTNWDGQWYQYIATDGYIPASQGVTPASSWAWAFPPGYPLTVGLLMRLTGLPFTVVGPTLSLLLGAIGMVILFRLLEQRGGRFLAVTGVATTSFFVSAPLFQAAYSESMAFLVLVSILYAVGRERWWLASALTVVLALVRLVTPPIALIAVLAGIVRYRSGRRSFRDVSGPALLGLAAMCGPLVWPAVSERLLGAGAVEGSDRAVGAARDFAFGWFGAFAEISPWLVLPVVGVVFLLWRIMSGEQAGHWGLDVRTWGWSYPLFVLLVTMPTAGFVRYLLLAFPLGLPVAASTRAPSKVRALLLVVVCVVLQVAQVIWIRYAFLVGQGSIGP